uniref:Uncharacterized protein n=1 Tax=Arundo donax TaxID=35708 RepID=A0A0A8YL84_ARUDO
MQTAFFIRGDIKCHPSWRNQLRSNLDKFPEFQLRDQLQFRAQN